VSENPLLAPWIGPYGGVPPFTQVKTDDLAPALEAAMSEMRRELATIATAPPSFDGTIAALEDAGRTLARVQTVYDVWASTMSDDAFKAVERTMAPKLAAFDDEIVQNRELFTRVKAVYEAPELKQRSPEEQRLAWRTYDGWVRSGANVEGEAKARLSAINQRLASLYATFNQNVLADEEGHALFLTTEAELDGLPESVQSAAFAEAEARGKKGAWAITNTRSSVEPFLTYAKRRDLREAVFRTFVRRGDGSDAHDNKAVLREILKLRAERAKLLGYATHAHWRVQNSMAKTPERAMALMEAVWRPAVLRVREEVRDMQAIADADGITITPWDYRFYAEKVRKQKYDLDEGEVKEFLELENLREAMFWVAGRLYGVSFLPAASVPVAHADIRVWEVTESGKSIGLWYFDPYARSGKQSGAWMSAYRSQERFRTEIATIVSNNSNFMKGKAGEPILVSWSDATTLFHEFGHAIHGLLSNVNYPKLSGTNVARDFVEFPSQLFEHWLGTPEVLERFALHHATRAPMPKALADKIAKAATFNQGFGTVEYLSAALVDMKLHLTAETEIDPAAFEQATLDELGMPAEVVMRHRLPHFSHLFSGDSYSAGYYSYLWADTLTADAFEAFTEGAGPFDRDVAERLRKHVLSVGDTVDPAESYRAFRGRDPGIEPLMRKRGF
jgi:peptidyl-dipeptidase Dcp